MFPTCYEIAAAKWCIYHTSSRCPTSTSCAAYARRRLGFIESIAQMVPKSSVSDDVPRPIFDPCGIPAEAKRPSTAPSGRISPVRAGRCDMIEASTTTKMLPGFLASRDESSGYRPGTRSIIGFLCPARSTNRPDRVIEGNVAIQAFVLAVQGCHLRPSNWQKTCEAKSEEERRSFLFCTRDIRSLAALDHEAQPDTTSKDSTDFVNCLASPCDERGLWANRPSCLHLKFNGFEYFLANLLEASGKRLLQSLYGHSHRREFLIGSSMILSPSFFRLDGNVSFCNL